MGSVAEKSLAGVEELLNVLCKIQKIRMGQKIELPKAKEHGKQGLLWDSPGVPGRAKCENDKNIYSKAQARDQGGKLGGGVVQHWLIKPERRCTHTKNT